MLTGLANYNGALKSRSHTDRNASVPIRQPEVMVTIVGGLAVYRVGHSISSPIRSGAPRLSDRSAPFSKTIRLKNHF